MTIINADCLEWMKTQADSSIDCVVTDPPYGLKFMGKKWDHGLPSVEIWQEALRISKPGAWLLAFGGTRTHHRLTCNIEDAGWEIRDCIMWIYGSGFPKGKGQLKPAYEPIILARKKAPAPMLNIDECRIPIDRLFGREKYANTVQRTSGISFNGNVKESQNTPLYNFEKGRWPANIILDEEAGVMLDEQSGVSFSKSNQRNNKASENKCMSGSNTGHISYGHDDSGGASRFFYCPKASSSERNAGLEELELKRKGENLGQLKGLTGSGNPRNYYVKNYHPTVKPLKLMEYLIKLVMPKGGILLDLFAGSGTTILAAQNLGVKAIGIEKEAEYCEIARARLKRDKQLSLDL